MKTPANHPIAYGFETLRVDSDSLTATFTTSRGAPVHCRLIRPDDAQALIDLFAHLSPQSRRRRFNASLDNIEPDRLAQEARQLAAVDNRAAGGAWLAFVDSPSGPTLVAVARLGRFPHAPRSPSAEAALVVRDDFQGQGIGATLMVLLALLARRMDVKVLTASVQADNEPLFALLRHLHLPLKRRTTQEETTITISVDDLPMPDDRA